MTDPSQDRAERLAAIRRQIDEGTYETRDKLEAAVERLLDQLVDRTDDQGDAAG